VSGLDKLKKDCANECANDAWKYFMNSPLKKEPAIIYEYGAHYGFIEGFNTASAEYEYIIKELEKVLIVCNGVMAHTYDETDDKFFLDRKEDIQEVLQKLKEFRS